MLSRNQVKYIQSLKLSKFRQQHRQFIAEGTKLAGELLDSTYEIHEVFALKPWLDQHQDVLDRKKISNHEISEDELNRISLLKTPVEVLMVVNMPEEDQEEIQVGDLTLFLDRIQDPGNMGTIIRTADWFGIRTIVCSPGCADQYNPKVVQATMGSITRVKVIEKDAETFFGELPEEVAIYGTVLEGENIYQADLEVPAVILIGNESQGISAQVLPFVQRKISIPGWSAKAESLNASVATGIVCAEFRRRSG